MSCIMEIYDILQACSAGPDTVVDAVIIIVVIIVTHNIFFLPLFHIIVPPILILSIFYSQMQYI